MYFNLLSLYRGVTEFLYLVWSSFERFFFVARIIPTAFFFSSSALFTRFLTSFIVQSLVVPRATVAAVCYVVCNHIDSKGVALHVQSRGNFRLASFCRLDSS